MKISVTKAVSGRSPSDANSAGSGMPRGESTRRPWTRRKEGAAQSESQAAPQRVIKLTTFAKASAQRPHNTSLTSLTPSREDTT